MLKEKLYLEYQRRYKEYAEKHKKVEELQRNVADIQAEDGIHEEHILDVTYTVVHNSKGVELPSTGGMGTIWLITIGTLLAIAFAIFLITHKKMSIYED